VPDEELRLRATVAINTAVVVPLVPARPQRAMLSRAVVLPDPHHWIVIGIVGKDRVTFDLFRRTKKDPTAALVATGHYEVATGAVFLLDEAAKKTVPASAHPLITAAGPRS
jgi:hypothetical protein